MTSTAPTALQLPGTPPGWVNGAVRVALRVPLLRGWIGKSFGLITVTGAKSGRTYTTPVQYMRDGGDLVVLSQKTRIWWRNLRSQPDVELGLGASELAGVATIASDSVARDTLRRCLRANPRVARFYGLDGDDPDPLMVGELLEHMVVITIHPVSPDL